MFEALLIIIGTILLFLLSMKLNKRFPSPFTLPILTTTIVTIVILLMFRIPYDTYMEGGKWINKMLGPAVVALAFPLYNQRQIIIKYKYSIISGVVIALLAGLVSIMALMLLFNVKTEWMLTALPKSLTTPVAMQVSDSIGGIAPLTAVFVMLAGFVGAIVGPVIFKVGKIESAISRGVSIGSASHGVGLTKLHEYGEQELSIGSLSMGLSAVIGAFVCPLFAYIFF